MTPKNLRDEYSVTLDWPIAATARWLPTTSLQIAQSEAADRKSLAAIITLHKIFIDWFAGFMNNLPIKHVDLGEKRWNRAMAAK
jgi:hypothetical protein